MGLRGGAAGALNVGAEFSEIALPHSVARRIFGSVSDDDLRQRSSQGREVDAGLTSATPTPLRLAQSAAHAVESGIDAALVRQARDGDRDAFGQLVRRHLSVVHSAALAITADQADAEDVMQDAFLTALTRIDECRPEEKFRGWLLVIVRNRALDLKRRQRVRLAEPLESADGGEGNGALGPMALASRIPGPLEDTERADARRLLEAALATLTNVRREVVLLHDLEGWSHREIATHLGLAEGTVRAHLFWARRALRERLRSSVRESEHGT